jgi:adenylate cyclase
MAVEIERKFLVKGDYKTYATESSRIVQGYLSLSPKRTVRVRIKGDKGFLTTKGMTSASGISRFEWEKEIPLEEAKSLMIQCDSKVIEKTRYLVPEKNGLMFEVDEFYGENEGLTMAEIELPSENHPFDKPDWLGEEVSGDLRYYNSSLVKNPFKKWQYL